MEWWRLQEDPEDGVVRCRQKAAGFQGVTVQGSPLFGEIVSCIQGQAINAKSTDVRLL